MLLLTAAIFALNVLSNAQTGPPDSGTNSTDPLTNVTMAFAQAQVVPDVLPTFNPVISADILFMDSATSESVQVLPDELLTMQQTHNPPQFFLSSDTRDISKSNASWVIAIVDPDAPTPQNPNISQFLHFIGQDFIVDNSSTTMDLGNMTALTNTTQALVEFFPPTPPAGSDPHRYVVLVYVQPANFTTTAPTFFNGTIDNTDASFRMNFTLADFVGNTSLGSPVAGNFFLVGPQDSNTTTAPTTSRVVPTATAPLTTVVSQPPPTGTSAADVNSSGAERIVGIVPLFALGILSAAIGLLII